MLASLVFLSPLGALVAVAAVVPLAAFALAVWRVRRTRAALGLYAPAPVSAAPKLVALTGIVALLAAAAAQPASRTRTTASVRTDAQAVFVIDVSRSMLAAGSPSAATRVARAKRDALVLRAAIPDVPSGVATMTDRVLPSLLPNPDLGVFDATVEHAVSIDEPPPEDESVVATSLAALGALGTQNWFPPAARKRLIVVLTDGETRPYDQSGVARALANEPGAHLVLVHVWKQGETIYDNGRPETGYHEDAASGAALTSLASAADGRSFGEGDLAAAANAERAALGGGPIVREGITTRTHTLAPYVALCALIPLLLLLGRPRRLGRATRPAVHRRELVSR